MTTCIACEGFPVAPNDPCGLCGTASEGANMTESATPISNTFLPCPFCGKTLNVEDGDTLYPTGMWWRIEDGMRHYVRHKDRKEGDKSEWGVHCAEVSGGCGAEITADSKQEAMDNWNKRSNDNRKAEIESLRARNDKLALELDNERILRYAAEAERNSETADATRFRVLIDQHSSIESTGDDSEYENCHIEYFCADIDYDLAQSVRRMLDREVNSKVQENNSAVQAETERCAKIAQEYDRSPFDGKAIAALIMNKGE